MLKYLIALFVVLLTSFSFGQIVLTQNQSDASIGLDRKAWSGLGNTAPLSDGYAHDFILPTRTNPCQQITGIRIEISFTNYFNNNVCPHFETYYNLFYGCTTYAGGATCLPATNLIAEPNYAPITNPPIFNYGSPLGSPLNSNIVPDFGENLSIDIIPVSNPGCNPVTNGNIRYEYTITVTVTVTDILTVQPPSVNCWDNYVFNTTTCVWENLGTQPVQPTSVNCWDNYVFNTTTCAWENLGTQPVQPTSVNCWDNYVFNTATCVWENLGTQPVQPPLLNCWDNYVFNTTTCVWENLGTQPVQPSSVNCWDNYVFNTTACVWENLGTQPVQPPLLNCWDNYVFNKTTCVWENLGTQPVQPSSVNCWDNYVFNTTTCVWENLGTQPVQPTSVNCWDNYVFNTNACVWENLGTQPGNLKEVNLNLCVGETIDLFAQTNIINPSFNWSNGANSQSISITNGGRYTVEITSTLCSFETVIFNVTPLEAPVLDNVFTDGNDIIVSTVNSGNFQYSLDGFNFQSTPIFRDVIGGLYTIYVKRQDCTEVVTTQHLHFYIPKFFTPNNDGVNDTFNLAGIEFYSDSQVSIFNRYGKLIKFSKNSPLNWDGTYNGELLPSDDYWYEIIIENNIFTGHFTLKR
ncbi:T9SS type B sorting domain-containing protein [Litoribaculum gwangyangense]|uniref:Gliding motility-associated C-terminal domain-containing protein n=1 Tax=Litoribaculum gwangyangense TaxID=1130722 RepID=A0ABP9C0H8_9FLAO